METQIYALIFVVFHEKEEQSQVFTEIIFCIITNEGDSKEKCWREKILAG